MGIGLYYPPMGNHNQKISTAPKLSTVERIKNLQIETITPVFLEPPFGLHHTCSIVDLSVKVNKNFYKSLDIHTMKTVISGSENTC